MTDPVRKALDMAEMKLLKIKDPAKDYVVTVRNGKRLSGDGALKEPDVDKGREPDLEVLEGLAPATKTPWPDPAPD